MIHSAVLCGAPVAATTSVSSSSHHQQLEQQHKASPVTFALSPRATSWKTSTSLSSRILPASRLARTDERWQNRTRAMSSSSASSSSDASSSSLVFRSGVSHQRVLDDDGTSHPSDKAHRFGPLSSSVSRENRTKRAVITTHAIRDSSSGGGGGDSSNTEGEEKEKKRTTSSESKSQQRRKSGDNNYNDDEEEEEEEVSTRSYVQRRVESSGAYGDISNERQPRKTSSPSSSSSSASSASSAGQQQKKTKRTENEIMRHQGKLLGTPKLKMPYVVRNDVIREMPTIKALLNYIEAHILEFSVVNVATAIHKCGTFVRNSKYLRTSSSTGPISMTEVNPNARSLVEEDNTVGENKFATNEDIIQTCQNILENKVFQMLLLRLEAMVPRGDNPKSLTRTALDYGTPMSREYANILWGLAHCGVQTRLQGNELTTILFKQYVNCAKENNYSNFIGQNVSNVLWAYAIMSCSGRPVEVDESKEVYQKRDDYCVDRMYGGIPTEEIPLTLKTELLDTIERLNLFVMDGYVPQGVANCLWAYGTLRYRLGPEPAAAFRKGIAMHLGQPRRSSDYGFGAGNFKTQETSNILWACAQIRFDMGKDLAGMFLHSMTESIFNDPKIWSIQSLTNILWALAHLKDVVGHEVYTPPSGLLKRIEDLLEPKIETMFMQGIANTLWAYATLEYEPELDFLNRMSARWDKKLWEHSMVENCNAFWAYTKFKNFRPNQRFVDYLAKTQRKCTMLKEKWDTEDTSDSVRIPHVYTEETLTVMVFVNGIYGMAQIGATPGDGGRYFQHVMREMTEWLKVTYNPHQKNKNCTQPIVNYMRSLALIRYLPDNDFVEAMSKRAKMEAENDQFTVQGISQMLWSWSTLGLKIPKEVVFALVHALMRQWDRVRVQPLTTSIWALANMGFMDEKGVFEVFRKKFATLKVEQFVPDKDMLVTGGPVHHKAMNQGYQAHFAYEILSTNGKLMYPELEREARKNWMEITRTCVTISGFQQEVSSTLSEMGVPHELEFLSDGGLYSLDIALKGRKICIEADGPTHYSSNQPTVRIGGDNLREAVLTKQGWTLIQIPWFIWKKLPERGKFRRGYVANLLYEHAGLTMKQLTAGTQKEASLRDLGTDVFMSELDAPDMKENGTRLSSSSSSSSTTFSPYGMDFEKPSSSSSSSSSPSIHSSASSAPKRRKLSTSSSSSRVIQPVAPGTRRVSAKSPRRSASSTRKKASSLSDAESKRLAEKLGSRKVETPTDEGGSPTKRKVVKRRVKRKVVSSKDDAAAGGAEEGKNLKKSGAEGDVKE